MVFMVTLLQYIDKESVLILEQKTLATKHYNQKCNRSSQFQKIRFCKEGFMKHTANLARKETHVLHIPVDQQKNKQDFYNNDA